MNEPRVNRKTAATVLAVALILAGFGSVRAEQAVEDATFLTTGHTNFLDLDDEDTGCFAGLAGILMQRVLWFNGQELFSRAASGGDTWIYVTEHLNDDYEIDLGGDKRSPGSYDTETGIKRNDPSRETLYDTGNTYAFEDRNKPEKVWEVRELFAIREKLASGPDPAGTEKVYVWAVKVHDDAFRDPAIQRKYNFAMVIDTCKFHERSSHSEVEHGNGTHKDGDPAQDTRFGHDPNDPPGDHTHMDRPADVWIGGPPDISPIPTGQVEGNGSSSGDSGSGGDAS